MTTNRARPRFFDTLSSDRARLDHIKETGAFPVEVNWLVERLEEAIDLLRLESSSGLIGANQETEDFISRFENKP